jgi:hypothetical protein
MNNGNIYVQAYYRGGMTGFEVLCSDDIYKVFIDGHEIATLVRENKWKQVSGDPLPDEVVESIGMQIDRPQSQA